MQAFVFIIFLLTLLSLAMLLISKQNISIEPPHNKYLNIFSFFFNTHNALIRIKLNLMRSAVWPSFFSDLHPHNYLNLSNESSAMPLDIFPSFPLLFHESILNIYNAWAGSGLPLLNHSSLAAPSEVRSPFGDAEGRFLSSSSHTPPPLYDVTITHRCNKRRRDSPGRIPDDVTPRLI